MDFSKHYFIKEPIEEKLSDVVKDVATAGVGTVAKAAVKGVGRKIANVFRGATGRTQTIAFEPNWLKILKPVDLKTYKDLINKYANWKTQKTKLGPKKNFTITDNKDGRLGEFSKDEFIKIIGRFDKNIQQKLEALGDVKDLQNPKEIKIPMRMHVYIYNNGGKAVFIDMPINEDGKKRAYAIGLDNKAERAFRQVHGMPFQDYELVTGPEPAEEAEPKTAAEQGLLKHKYIVPPRQYQTMIPKREMKLAASVEYPFNLFSLYEKEVLDEDKKYVYKDKEGKWWSATTSKSSPYEYKEFNSKSHKYIAVKEHGSKEKDEELQKELDTQINKQKESSTREDQIKDQGSLYQDLKNELNPKYPPSKTKASEKTKRGWRFSLKNGGVIYVYETTDGKYMISFDDKAKSIVDEKDLVKKYQLEKSDETPEVESPE